MIGRAQVSKKFSLFSSNRKIHKSLKSPLNEHKEAGYFHFGPIWTPLDHFKQKLIFCSRAPPPKPYFFHLGQKTHFCLKWSKGVRMGQKGSQIVKNTWVDHFGMLTSLPCLAIFGPKRTIFGPSPFMKTPK